MGVYMSHIYSGDWADNLPNGEGAEHYDVDISKLTSTKGRMLQDIMVSLGGRMRRRLFSMM